MKLALEGVPYRKPKHRVGGDTIGADLGPSTIALVPREAEASLSVFCQELAPDAKSTPSAAEKNGPGKASGELRRLRLDGPHQEAQRQGKEGKGRLVWKSSKSYQKTRRRKAAKERKLAAHRKSLHGRLVHEIIAVGNTIILEKISYTAWQKQYGTSVGLRAPGMFIDMLRRTVASMGGTLIEVSTRTTKLSQYCHGCRQCEKKSSLTALASVRLWRWANATGSLFGVSGRLPRSTRDPDPSDAQYQQLLGTCGDALAGSMEGGISTGESRADRAPSFGIPRARARLPRSLNEATQEPTFLVHTRVRLEAWKQR